MNLKLINKRGKNMDVDFSILNGIFSKITDIKDNLTSTDTNKPLSAKQGKILNENKLSNEGIYILDANIVYTDDSMDTVKILIEDPSVNNLNDFIPPTPPTSPDEIPEHR